MKLNLGVIDVPYTDHSQSETTGEVAIMLEEKYSVMDKFYAIHGQEIADDIASGIAGAIENAIAGKKNPDLFAGAMQKTGQRFRSYIDTQEHGITLKKQSAPKAGARKKRQYKKVKTTTAFIDSGLYRKMFKSWIEE